MIHMELLLLLTESVMLIAQLMVMVMVSWDSRRNQGGVSTTAISKQDALLGDLADVRRTYQRLFGWWCWDTSKSAVKHHVTPEKPGVAGKKA